MGNSSYSILRDDDDDIIDRCKDMISSFDPNIPGMNDAWHEYERNPHRLTVDEVFEGFPTKNVVVNETHNMLTRLDLSNDPVDLILGIRIMTPGTHALRIYWRDVLLDELVGSYEEPIVRLHRIIPYMSVRLYGLLRVECASDMLVIRFIYATIETRIRSRIMMGCVIGSGR